MNGAVWTCTLSCNRESWRPSHVLLFVFAGVTAVAPCSTPSVDRKLSRALAVFAENSTTRGRPLSGHLTTTAPGAFSCPTRTPETRTKAVTVRALSDHCAGQSACFFFFFSPPTRLLDEFWNRGRSQRLMHHQVWVPANTHTPELSLRPAVKSRDETNCCTRLHRPSNLNVLQSNITNVNVTTFMYFLFQGWTHKNHSWYSNQLLPPNQWTDNLSTILKTN